MSSKLQLKRKFIDYLNVMKSVKASSFTHTSITLPAGSFYLDYNDLKTFNMIYKEAMKNECELFMTEKHRDISPVLLDFDFRFGSQISDRKYTMDMLKRVLSIYVDNISKYVELPENIDVYVLEKQSPTVCTGKNITKDGVHIIIPNIVTRPSIQILVRKNSLKEIEKVFESLNTTNSIEDIFDEQVIWKNNWQMYGSKKPNSEPYVVTHNFTMRANDASVFVKKPLLDDHTEYVDILSIRNKFEENGLIDTNIEAIRELDFELKQSVEDKEKKQTMLKNIIQSRDSNFRPVCEDMELVKQLMKILKPARADSYGDWIRLGWCLRNVSIDLLEEWDNFSKHSDKYEAGECDKLWYRMREGGLGLGTLHMWVKQDNPDQYARLMSEDISSFIRKSMSQTDYDIALVIARMFKHRFRCSSHKHHTWYEYDEHRWKEIEKGYTLFYKEIPNKLHDEYQKAIECETQRSRLGDARDKDICNNNIETLNKIAKKLRSTNFVKDKMYKECSGLFYEPKFEDKLDSNPTLLGFENGVYDLESHEFREGRPEDYISLSTGINYIEYDVQNPFIEEINDFMKKVLVNDNVREYVLTLFASILDGTNRDEKFHIWTGSGSNGKSKLVDLFQHTIGDYACIFNVSLLTQKRVGSSATNSELAIAKGKRFAILQEPEEHERLNVGLMKELTGGDQIQCRSLFKEPIRFKPMFKMILTCNHMPAIPPDDGGTWRRVRRVEYTSKFVDNPNDDNPNEFLIDRDLGYKFDLWKETFMVILLQYYKKYKKVGKIVDPEEVLGYTKEYQRKNDVFADFCDCHVEKAEKADKAEISVNVLFEKFKEYCAVDNIKNKVNKTLFQEAMCIRYGKLVTSKGVKCWKNIKLIEREINLEQEDDDL
jgi:P4 family phage/plasmid primase-like protien